MGGFGWGLELPTRGPPGAGSGHHPGCRTGIDYGAKLGSPLFMCRVELLWGECHTMCIKQTYKKQTTAADSNEHQKNTKNNDIKTQR